MKKITYILLALPLLIGCNLDRTPLDALAPENTFNNKEELETATNGFYAMLPNAEDLYGETADLVVPTTLTNEVLGIRTVPASGGGWSWRLLSDINTCLIYSARCKDANVRAEYDGVSRFFRAYFYFEKVRRFGEVPWFDTPLTSTDDRLYQGRTDRNTLLDNMLADIDYAAQHLPAATNVYKITKWTALAMKSRMALFEGTFRKYHGIAGYERYLQLAADAAKDFMDNSPYTIYKEGNTPYMNLFASKNAIKSEVIMALNYNIGLNIVHDLNRFFTSDGAKPGLNKKIVDSYLMYDGTRFTDKADYQTMGFYDEMQGRDPRLAQTIVTPGYKRIGGTDVLSPSFSAATTGYQIIKGVTTPADDAWHKSQNDFPLFRAAEVYLNYAEAKAELGTLTQADLDASILKIRQRVGMPGIDMAAANATPDPYLSNEETGYPNVTGANKGVILEIRRERTIELLCEGFRYYDLIRWKAGKVFEKQFKGMYFGPIDTNKQFSVYDMNGNAVNDALDICIYSSEKIPSKTDYPELKDITVFLKLGENLFLENGMNGGNVIVHDIKTRTRTWNEDRDYLYPIPQSQITLYGGALKQNPGW
ncbi:MAG: RagB/SusD family nutrient uptake outer membrane protein [Prevotella sp.]|jgi:putative lipoprotein